MDTQAKIVRGNVQLQRGGAVHAGSAVEGYVKTPICGGNKAANHYREVSGEVTCKRCLKMAEAEAPRPPAEGVDEGAEVVDLYTGTQGIVISPVKGREYAKVRASSGQVITARVTMLRPLVTELPAKVPATVVENVDEARRMAYTENEQRNLTAANKVAESLFTILVQQHGASMTSEHVGDGIRRFEVTLNGHHLHITHDARTQVCVLRDGTRFEAATFLPELGEWLDWTNGQGGRPSWLPEYEPAELVTQTVVDCFECQETHPAEPAGQTQTFGSLPPRPRYAVMCGSYLDYYTDEVVYTRTLAVRTPGLDLSARS